uniref:Uncharacterized protein n=1 Tax=Lepeophtheirus salmonis TaxID=72036 RepID=A0A0K2UKL2_LEPSM
MTKTRKSFQIFHWV